MRSMAGHLRGETRERTYGIPGRVDGKLGRRVRGETEREVRSGIA